MIIISRYFINLLVQYHQTMGYGIITLHFAIYELLDNNQFMCEILDNNQFVGESLKDNIFTSKGALASHYSSC
jgi:hypothetical protein